MLKLPDSTMKPTDAPISSALIAICEKCGRKISGRDDDGNVSRQVQKAIKAEIADLGRKSEFRAVVSSCLHVCPEGTVAVAVLPLNGRGARFFEVDVSDPAGAQKVVLAEALRTLG